jgi:hypothetical protein
MPSGNASEQGTAGRSFRFHIISIRVGETSNKTMSLLLEKRYRSRVKDAKDAGDAGFSGSGKFFDKKGGKHRFDQIDALFWKRPKRRML